MKIKRVLRSFIERNKEVFTVKKITFILVGLCISSFGVYNIHRQTDITEGGVIGMLLLLNHWTGISVSILSPMLDIICYAIAFRYLGWDFIKLTIVSTVSLAGYFKLWESIGTLLPDLSAYPLMAAVLGGIFVGIGVGLVVRQGGSSGGDDALALAISKVTKCRISRAYLITDFTVLLLSLSYISMKRIGFSLVTVTISSLLIDWVHTYKRKEPKNIENE